MNFREWFLTEEFYFQNNTATVFHRTKEPKNIKGIISSGYRPGTGCFHGCGLYTTYELSAQMRSNMIGYGHYIMKYKVTNLNKYLVFELDKAKQIHKENWTLSSQITRLSPSLAKAIEKSEIISFKELDERQKTSENGSDISQFLHEKFKLDYFASLDKETFKGIIYYGQQDGPCLLKYNPINEGTDILLLAYAYAPSGINIESLQWIQSTSLASLRTHSKYSKQMQDKEFKLPKDDDSDILSELLSSSSDPDLTAKKIIYNRRDSLTDGNVLDLLSYTKNKQKIAKWIINYKPNLNDENVFQLLHDAPDKQEVANLLGSENISKLSDNNVYRLLSSVEDKQEIADLLGSENINKLSDDNIYFLIHYADDKQEIADLLGSENMNKLNDDNINNLLLDADDKQEMAKWIIKQKNNLSDDNVFSLLEYAYDKQEIADLLGSENIDKLSDIYVYLLLYYTKNKQKIADILGSKNINKLNDQHVGDLLNIAIERKEMADILGSENISKLSTNNIGNLLLYVNNRPDMAEIILKYHNNLSDEAKAKLKAVKGQK